MPSPSVHEVSAKPDNKSTDSGEATASTLEVKAANARVAAANDGARRGVTVPVRWLALEQAESKNIRQINALRRIRYQELGIAAPSGSPYGTKWCGVRGTAGPKPASMVDSRSTNEPAGLFRRAFDEGRRVGGRGLGVGGVRRVAAGCLAACRPPGRLARVVRRRCRVPPGPRQVLCHLPQPAREDRRSDAGRGRSVGRGLEP